jgi:hypothetical protein
MADPNEQQQEEQKPVEQGDGAGNAPEPAKEPEAPRDNT